MSDNRCICCGEIIPEGMIACPNCLVVSKKTPGKTAEQILDEANRKIIRPTKLAVGQVTIGIACLICGESVPTTFGDFSPKICKKCRDAVMKMRGQDV